MCTLLLLWIWSSACQRSYGLESWVGTSLLFENEGCEIFIEHMKPAGEDRRVSSG